MIPPRVTVVGSYNQDHVWRTDTFPVPGETRLGQFHSGPGGKGFNQAVAAARQGAATHFIAALGDDALGEAAMQLASDEGLTGRWQRDTGRPTGTAAVLLDGHGQNLIVVGPGANAALSVAHIDACADSLRATRVLLTQHEVAPAATARAIELAHAAGALCVHNPAPPVARGAQPPLAGIAILTPNETEFAALLRDHAGHDVRAEQLAAQDDAVLHRLCRDLGVPTVIVTLGAEGLFVSQDSGYARLAAEPATVRDTTGAGDAFNGGLAAALAAGQPLLDAAAHGNRVAALKIERAGAALAMPTLADVRHRFATDL